MTRRSLVDWATVAYILVDDGYQAQDIRLLQGQVGAKPVCTDREVIPLRLWRDFRPFPPGESPCLGFVRAPIWLFSPGSATRVRSIAGRGACTCGRKSCGGTGRRPWEPPSPRSSSWIPARPRGGLQAEPETRRFCGVGCLWGVRPPESAVFRLQTVRLSTREGLPVASARVPAPTDGRATADTVRSVLWHGAVCGDQGLPGADGPQAQWEHYIGTPTWVHLCTAHSAALPRGLHSLRAHGKPLPRSAAHRERLRCQTVLGVTTHAIVQMACHTLRHLLRRFFGRPVRASWVIPHQPCNVPLRTVPAFAAQMHRSAPVKDSVVHAHGMYPWSTTVNPVAFGGPLLEKQQHLLPLRKGVA